MQSQIERRVGHRPAASDAKRERVWAAILTDTEGWETARRARAAFEAGGHYYRWDGKRFERVEGTPVA